MQTLLGIWQVPASQYSSQASVEHPPLPPSSWLSPKPVMHRGPWETKAQESVVERAAKILALLKGTEILELSAAKLLNYMLFWALSTLWASYG